MSFGGRCLGRMFGVANNSPEHQIGFRPEPTLKATGRSSPLADLYTLARRSNAARILSESPRL